MARTGKPAVRRVAAVARAMDMLEALASADGELGTNEIARRTGVNASTVSRVLSTLAENGYVAHVEETGRYRLGLRLLELGNVAVAGLDLRQAARSQLRKLVETTGETATLSVPGERDAVTVDFVQSAASVQSVARLGRPSVAHATATGKVGLAFGESRLADGSLAVFTKRTIIDRTRLAAEVARTHKRGYSAAAGEREQDLNAIAAPVFGSRGELAAIIGVQGPASRFDRGAMRAAVPALLGASHAVSHALGWRPTGEEAR